MLGQHELGKLKIGAVRELKTRRKDYFETMKKPGRIRAKWSNI